MAVPARVSTDPTSVMSTPSATPRPYAGPTAASSAALELARGLLTETGAGPYVPAEWRRADATTARVAELTPSTPMAAVAVDTTAVESVAFAVEPEVMAPEAIAPEVIEAEAMDAAAYEPNVHETPTADSADLPWIDSFLASTPPLPMMAIPTSDDTTHAIDATLDEPSMDGSHSDDLTADVPMAAVEEDQPSVLLAGVDSAQVVDEVSATADASPEMPDDTWPLDEATPDFERLSQQIDAAHGPEVVSTPGKGAPSVPEGTSETTTSSMSPWSDEEFMDIMPVRRALRTPMSSQAVDMSSQWAERARAAQVARDAAQGAGVGRASEAAEALEMLARRVRSGELTVPEFDGRMGESAALVAALAAVLGVRLR